MRFHRGSQRNEMRSYTVGKKPVCHTFRQELTSTTKMTLSLNVIFCGFEVDWTQQKDHGMVDVITRCPFFPLFSSTSGKQKVSFQNNASGSSWSFQIMQAVFISSWPFQNNSNGMHIKLAILK